MLIIVGLGNPTAEYAETYHNMGFKAVDAIAEGFNKSIKKAECNALTVTFSRKNEKIVLAKPLTTTSISNGTLCARGRSVPRAPTTACAI